MTGKPFLTAFIILLIFCFARGCSADDIEWQGIVVHHSATETGDVEIFREYHINTNGWVDVGYNYVITREGIIQKGRALDIPGAHAKGRNATHIGICLVGTDSFNAKQKLALILLCQNLIERFPIKTIERHHEECPGVGLNLEELSRAIFQKEV